MKRRGAEAVQVYFQMLLVALSNLPGRVGSIFGNSLSAWLFGFAGWAPLAAAATAPAMGTAAMLALPESAG